MTRVYSNFRQAVIALFTVDATPRALIVSLICSTVLGFAALALGGRSVVVEAALLLPWALIVARKLRADGQEYGWLAVFELLVILQIGHFAEHVSQVIELHGLAWPPILAKGIVGELDIEPVHFWWNTIILFAATLLLMRYRQNRWLWGSWLFSIYIYFFWYLAQGVSGHPGILGAGGLVDAANISIPVLTSLGRADLHFWYNLFEIGLFVMAFMVQVAALQPRPATAPAPRLSWQRRLVLAGFGQVALLTLIGLVRFSPATLRVPQNYATIQNAIDAAPEWAIVRLAPGEYHESLRITKPLALVGSGSGATRIWQADDNVPTIAVLNTHDVRIQNLTVEGGLYAILVDKSHRVQISNNAVLNAWFVGIRVSQGDATIESNQVIGTRSPYGMGIEVANTMFSPATMIDRNTVRDHAHEGIVTHNSNAMIEQNIVEQNGLRGIAITEMSMAKVRWNQIAGNADAGIFVVDHSMADLEGNHVRSVLPGPLGTAYGIKGNYYAEITLGSNTIDLDPAHRVVLMYDATIEP
jgi:nitrous oxidase accessory protein NosD